MAIDEIGLYILKSRYLQDGETPEELFRRVAKHVASAEQTPPEKEKWEERFYSMMIELDFLPNSPTLFNAGRNENGFLSACFVLPIPDHMDGIMETAKDMAMIQKHGGGTGFDFSGLRPEGDKITSTGGTSSGPVSFLKMYNGITEAVKQGGFRRGANMGIMRIDHQDIRKFIHCKDDGDIQNFNISIAITDEFMQSLSSKDIDAKYRAHDLFDEIVESAWKTGDPGVIFIDEINHHNPIDERIDATNPCGEQPLLPYESCNLGSINLLNMLKLDGDEVGNSGWVWDMAKLRITVRDAVRFLDNVIDVNPLPPKIEEQTKKYRKIGLGIMGWADCLIRLGIPYDSEEHIKEINKVMGFIQVAAWQASEMLAKERGTFPGVKKARPAIISDKVRNATVTTIAPTGTISMIAGVSSGIEPHFAFIYEKKVREGDKFVEIQIDVYERHNLQRGREDLFRNAEQIDPKWHLKVQAEFQKNVDNAVSKTINLPHTASKADIKNIYAMAWDMGCKGITVYRDRCREVQILNKADESFKKAAEAGKTLREEIKEVLKNDNDNRPRMLNGRTIQTTTGCGNLYVTINEHSGRVYEVFTSIGKAGGCANAQSTALCKLISKFLQRGGTVEELVRTFKGIRCPNPCGLGDNKTLSCPDALAKTLEASMSSLQTVYIEKERYTNKNNHKFQQGACPDCGGELSHSEGCTHCTCCTFSRCG